MHRFRTFLARANCRLTLACIAIAGRDVCLLRYAKAWLERIRRLGPEGALLVRYEDLKADCPQALRRMVAFLGFSAQEVDGAQLACACETASLESTHRRPRPYGPRGVLTEVDLQRLVDHTAWLRQLGYTADLDQPVAVVGDREL